MKHHYWEYIISTPATHSIFIPKHFKCLFQSPSRAAHGKCSVRIWSLLKFHETHIKTTSLNWARPQIIRADQSHYSFEVSQVWSVRFHWCDCHNHKALRWKLIIMKAGCLDKSMTGSLDGWEAQVQMDFILSSFCIYLTITVLEDIFASISVRGTSIRDVQRII